MADVAKGIKCTGTNLNNGFAGKLVNSDPSCGFLNLGAFLVRFFAEGPNKFVIGTSPSHSVTKLQIAFEGPAQPETKLVTKENKTVDVTFVTAVGGNYKIHVMYDGHYVQGSPYNCKIIGDVKPSVDKVKVSGAIGEAKANVENEVIIDGREVGIVAFSAKMEGPSTPDLAFKDNPDGTVSAVYKPTAPGNYKLHLKYTHFNLQGSPFKITCA